MLLTPGPPVTAPTFLTKQNFVPKLSPSLGDQLPAAVCVSKRWLLELSFISSRPLAELSPACVAPGPILLARPKQKCTLIGQ